MARLPSASSTPQRGANPLPDAPTPWGGSGVLLDAVTTVRRVPVLPVARRLLSPGTRWTIGLAGALLLGVLAVLGLRLVQDPLRFPVSNVDVLGTLDYTDRDRLQGVIARFTDRGFYALDIEALRHELETMPWIAEARIAREWPGRVNVTLEEHEPAARWNDRALVSKRLELFRPPQLQPDDVRYQAWRRLFSTLPGLSGAEGRHQPVLDDYRRYAAQLALAGLSIVRLEEDDRRSQTLELDGGITLRLGYEERELRMTRFLDVYPQLIEQGGNPPTRFDMRYSDGFAVAGDASR